MMQQAAARSTRIVDLNLLPASQRPAEVSGRTGAIVVAFILAIAALVPLAVYTHGREARAADMQHRAEQAQKQLDSLQLEFVQARALRIETEQALADAASLEAERRVLQQGHRPLHEELAMLQQPGFLPPDAQITRITGLPNALLVEGSAAGPLEAIAYAEHLAAEGGFPSARLASFAPATSGPSHGVFTVEVTR